MRKNTIKNCIRGFCFLLASLLHGALSSCAKDTETAPRETYGPVTDPITGERVRVTPKPRPTAPPDISSQGLEFPSSGVKLGNQTGGRIFPEPAEYLVLCGSGGVHYVYSSMGELCGVFQSDGDLTGFYGEYGVCGDFSLKLMDYFPLAEYVKRCADIFVGFAGDNDEMAVSITDWRCEKTVFIEGGGIDVGKWGVLMHVEDKYIAEYGSEDEEVERNLTLIDSDGSVIGGFDETPFGRIEGVLGGKYLVCYDPEKPVFDSEDWLLYDLYDISGNLIEEKVQVRWYNDFSYTMFGDYYLKDGKWHDCDGNKYDVFPQNAVMSKMYRSVERIELEGLSIRIGGWSASSFGFGGMYNKGIYAGVVDASGNWLFKIYSPNLDSDSKPQSRSLFSFN